MSRRMPAERIVTNIEFYILRRMMVPLVSATLIVLTALSLERMLRLLDETLHSEGTFFLLVRMLLNLAPNYLGVALPAAFFLSVMVAFSRLNQDSELTALNAAGIGLHQLVRPAVGLALLLAVVSGLVFGFLQPYGRYAYRALAYAVSHTPISSVLPEGTFVRVGGMVFMADQVSRPGPTFVHVFVGHEEKSRSVTTTARLGTLQSQTADQPPVLYLQDGVRVSLPAGASRAQILSFQEYRWPIGAGPLDAFFRPRGKDERELTLFELWRERSHPPEDSSLSALRAEFNARIVRSLSILFLPFLAIPLSLTSRRYPQAYSMAGGAVLLVVYHEILQMGETLATLGRLPSWAGLWVPFFAFCGLSLWLFRRATLNVTDDPMGSLFQAVQERIVRLHAAYRRQWSGGAG